MTRGRRAREWVKLDCYGVLHGSINYRLSLAEQAVWIKMICYSGMCAGRPGFIEDAEQKGVPSEYLAMELHCTKEELKHTVNTMIEDNAVLLHDSGSLEIVNFNTYQFTEYDRQLKYRNAKKQEENNDPEKYKKGKYGHLVRT